MIIKMVLTVIIIIAMVFTFVSYVPVSGFLTKAGIDNFKIANKPDNAAIPDKEISAGNIAFELKAKKYSSFSATANGEISAKGNTAAEGNGVVINTNSLVRIEGYYGIVDIDGTKTKLNGSVSKIYLPDATFTTDSILLTSTAQDLGIKNIEAKELRISGVLGTIAIKGTETAFTGTLILTNAVAELNLKCASMSDSCELVISGNAASVEIPEAGLRFK